MGSSLAGRAAGRDYLGVQVPQRDLILGEPRIGYHLKREGSRGVLEATVGWDTRLVAVRPARRGRTGRR